MKKFKIGTILKLKMDQHIFYELIINEEQSYILLSSTQKEEKHYIGTIIIKANDLSFYDSVEEIIN